MPVTMGEIVEFAANFGWFANVGAYEAAQRKSLRRASPGFLVVGTAAAVSVASVTARIAAANLNP